MLNNREYAAQDGLGLGALVASKQVTADELLQAALAAVERLNPKINAICRRRRQSNDTRRRVGRQPSRERRPTLQGRATPPMQSSVSACKSAA
jgi:Asp-tRNA(Asn)/Glu-tRNA(Gln) amidotransferase A subunit family amidase